MNLKSTTLLFALTSALTACQTPAPEPFGAVPTPAQLAWQQMETNMFVHFGPNTYTDSEWGSGVEDINLVAPEALDCNQWVSIAKQSGMKGVIFTAKHHDGVSLWPNPASQTTLAQSTWRDGKGDILQELSDACRAQGVKMGVYISPWDRRDPTYGTDAYNDAYCRSLEDVLSRYGEVFEQWFDGACGEGPSGKKQVYDWARIFKTVQDKQPNATIFSDIGPGCRWIGNEEGYAGERCWATLNTEGYQPGKSPALDTLNCGNVRGAQWVAGEADVSIRPGWFYHPAEDDQVKSLSELLKIYYGSVGRNSVLLLNVPPMPNGLISPIDSVRLLEFRTALDTIFAEDLAQGAKIEASKTRGNSRRFAAANLLDNDPESYWAVDDSVRQATITLHFDSPRTFNRILLQEPVALGQRIAGFRIEVADSEGNWREVTRQTTIGYKRILLTETLTATALRLTIEESLACPLLSRIGLYMDHVMIEAPTAQRDKAGWVTLQTTEPDAEIRYTTDGTAPTLSSPLYTAPFAAATACTVRAVTCIEGKPSSISNFHFDIAPTRFRVLDLPNADGITDGLSDEGDEAVSHGAVVKSDQPILLDLGENVRLTGIFYEPLLRGRFGCLVRYDLQVSSDANEWKLVSEDAQFGNVVNNPIRCYNRFEKPLQGRYLKISPRLTNLNDTYGIGEIGVLTR